MGFYLNPKHTHILHSSVWKIQLTGTRTAEASSSDMVRGAPGRSMPAPERVTTKAARRFSPGRVRGILRDQEKSKCSPGIPDTLGVHLEVVCEGGVLQ